MSKLFHYRNWINAAILYKKVFVLKLAVGCRDFETRGFI